MKNSLGFVVFLTGAALGSIATWLSVKEHYRQMYKQRADEEIASVKAPFTYKKTESTKEKKEVPKPKEKPSIAEYAKELSKSGYTKYSNAETPEEIQEKHKKEERPFVISPDEFGELEDEGYSKVSLFYYADEVLADDDDELVEDVDGWVGEDATDHFGEYDDDDCVYVRNPRLKIDFEILRSAKEYYTEVLDEKPWLRRYDE